jgi:hypothetical protein
MNSTETKVVYLEDTHKVTAAKQTAVSPYQQTASGYGNKLQTSYMVQIDGVSRWYRIYCICWSNSGSIYVLVKGQRFFIRDEYAIQDLAKNEMPEGRGQDHERRGNKD